MMTNTGVDRQAEAAEIQALQERQVAAFLYVRMYHQRVAIPQALAIPIRRCLWMAAAPTGGSPRWSRTSSAAGAAAAREFLEHGHTRIAFINNVDNIPASRDRLAGFRAELRRAGVKLALNACREGDVRIPRGTPRCGTLPHLPARPEAVFCFNDRVAMGVYQAAHQRRSEHSG